jgi:hypothetical protein
MEFKVQSSKFKNIEREECPRPGETLTPGGKVTFPSESTMTIADGRSTNRTTTMSPGINAASSVETVRLERGIVGGDATADEESTDQKSWYPEGPLKHLESTRQTRGLFNCSLFS